MIWQGGSEIRLKQLAGHLCRMVGTSLPRALDEQSTALGRWHT